VFFQVATAAQFIATVETITGRTVRAFASATDPDRGSSWRTSSSCPSTEVDRRRRATRWRSPILAVRPTSQVGRAALDDTWFSAAVVAVTASSALAVHRRRGGTSSFAERFDAWLEEHRPRIEPGTFRDYRVHGERRLKPFFGTLKPAAITPGDVRRYVAELVAEGRLSAKTINNSLAVLRCSPRTSSRTATSCATRRAARPAPTSG
jgi:Phage integrase, N-terminal SAM-like domain